MNNPNLEQSLAELEQSLIQINSAKTQVTNVAEKSEQLIQSISSAIKVITELNSGVNNELDGFTNELEKKLSKFESQIAQFNSKSNQSIEKTEENFVKLSNSIKNNGVEVEKAFSDFINVFEKTNEKIKEYDFQEEFRQLKQEVISTMDGFKISTKNQIEEVVKNHLEASSNQIFERLESIEKTSKSNQNRNLFVIIGGIIIVTALILIFEFK